MRIISGTLKGKPLLFLKDKNTRPLKDAVKENIFNILKHSNKLNVTIENAKVLDLYSGFGSLGIECLSRGAKIVTFFESNRIISNTLRRNLINLSIIDRANIINDKIENLGENLREKKFNIFFFDPPFKDNDFILNLKNLKEKKVFDQNHVIIIHREKSSKDNLQEYLSSKIVKVYGRSKIIFGVFD